MMLSSCIVKGRLLCFSVGMSILEWGILYWPDTSCSSLVGHLHWDGGLLGIAISLFMAGIHYYLDLTGNRATYIA